MVGDDSSSVLHVTAWSFLNVGLGGKLSTKHSTLNLTLYAKP